MVWQKYLNLEMVYKCTTKELEDIKNDLLQEKARQKQRFIDFKQELIQEFSPVFLRFQHYNYQAWLKSMEKEFYLKLEKAESITMIIKILEQLIRNVDIPKKLSDMLTSKYRGLCISGKLPRDFIVQVRPLILLKAQEAYVIFLHKANGIFSKANKEHMVVFEILIKSLSIAENEEEAKQGVQTAINMARNIKTGYRPLYDTLLKLQNILESCGYILNAPILSFDIEILQQAIDIAEEHIVLKTLNQNEQREQLFSSHNLAFALLREKKFGCKEIEGFITKYQKLINAITKTDYSKDTTDLIKLHNDLHDFWLNFSFDSLNELHNAKSRKIKKRLYFHSQLLKARTYLQRQGYLSENFVIDQQFLILERFDSYIQAAYRNSLVKLGDERFQQIENLRHQIKNASSSKQIARLLQINIEHIQAEHQEKSLGYNIPFIKRKSRAVGALQALLQDCESEHLLPKLNLRKPSAVEQHLAKTVEEYFSTDIFISNREHRYIVRKLFQAIRLVEDQINEERVLLIDGQQLIADLIEQTIRKIETHKKDTNIVKKAFGFLSNSNFVFTSYLKRAQTELLFSKQLVESYRYVIWPIVKEKLDKALNSYNVDAALSLCEDREAGEKEANELIIQMQEAVNAEQAGYLLAYGIRSFKGAFPLLTKKLEEAYQELRKEAVLPAVPQTEFSETIKHQIKQQTHDILELRARLFKIT